MRRYWSFLIAGGVLALGLNGASHAQVVTERADAHSVDVSSALRTGQAPGLRLDQFESLAAGDRIGFTIPATGIGAKSVANVDLLVDQLEHQPGVRRTWTMRAADGGFAHAQFVAVGGVLAGSITSEDGSAWRVVRRNDGVVQVDPIDEANLLPCANTQAVRTLRSRASVDGSQRVQLTSPGREQGGAPAGLRSAGIDDPQCTSPCPTRYLDVALFYTANARAGAGGLGTLQALAQLGILQANTAFSNSGTSLQLRVLTFEEVDYDDSVESGHLDHLLNTEDGYLDEIPQRMAELGADVSSLIVEFGEGWCGVAEFYPGRYSICVRFCLGGFLIAHEIGHNLGACHAQGDAGCDPATDFLLPEARGYRFVGDSGTEWRTVMASFPGAKIPYYSTPELLYDGVPIGQPADSPTPADNASVMELFSPIVKARGCPATEAQNVKVLPDVQNALDQFGINVRLGDSQLVVSALSADDVADDSGAVYSFKQLDEADCSADPIYGNGLDTCYTRNGILPVEGLRADDIIGASLAMTSTRLVAGAPLRDSAASGGDEEPLLETGSVFLFELNPFDDEIRWCYDTELVSSSPGIDDRFGESVAIDGITVVVGAPRADTVETFVRSGGSWVSSGTILGAPGTNFGEAVAISGNRLAIGAPQANEGAGEVYLFTRIDSGSDWQSDGVVTGNPLMASVGATLAMDGDRLLIGCPDSYDGYGAAMLYRHAGSAWAFEQLLTPLQTIYFTDSRFGAAVALEGTRAVIGAPQATYQDLQSFGLTYLYQFEEPDDRWYLVDVIIAYDLQSNHLYGSSVDLSGDLVAIGATGDETNALQSGAAYVQYFAPRPGNDCNENGYNDSFEGIQGISDDLNEDGVPDECGDGCLADLDGSGVVDAQDLTLLLGDWGEVDPSGGGASDINQDGTVDAQDLTLLLAEWGGCAG